MQQATDTSTSSHGGGHDDHPAHLAHHFETPKQQFESGKLGMWLFLSTEILLFGGLFCAYSIYRGNHPEIFKYASQFLDRNWGGLNTVILLISSFTMAWSVRNAQMGQQKLLKINLIITFICACGFMCVKFVEYKHKFHEGLVWGEDYKQQGVTEEDEVMALLEANSTPTPPAAEPGRTLAKGEELPSIGTISSGPGGLALDSHAVEAAGAGDVDKHEGDAHVADEHAEGSHGPKKAVEGMEPQNVHQFFGIYFVMTGLHGFHVLGGMVMIIWLYRRASRGEFGPHYFTPMDLGALYWHIVDLIWIFLFPLLYLI